MRNLKKAIEEATIIVEKEVYLEYQKADDLKVGDKVKVLRKAEDHENGWPDAWVQEMDSMVGKTYIIGSINEGGDIFLDTWGFPYFVLEKISPPIAEYLDYDETWRKSACSDKQVKGFAELTKDKKYRYYHDCDLLYRIKR